jgi:cell division protein ZipA
VLEKAPETKAVADSGPRAPKKVTSSRKIVAMRLAAGSDCVEGARLKSLLEGAGLRHGRYGIFHRAHTDGTSLFSVASMVEPGTFDPYAMSGVQFPGVTIFMQLPGPLDGDEMLGQMLACARELERGIGGLLQDERGLPLTEQRAQRLCDEVADFMHLLGQN